MKLAFFEEAYLIRAIFLRISTTFASSALILLKAYRCNASLKNLSVISVSAYPESVSPRIGPTGDQETVIGKNSGGRPHKRLYQTDTMEGDDFCWWELRGDLENRIREYALTHDAGILGGGAGGNDASDTPPAVVGGFFGLKA